MFKLNMALLINLIKVIIGFRSTTTTALKPLFYLITKISSPMVKATDVGLLRINMSAMPPGQL